MNKRDCKIGMFVAVIQHTSSLAKSRLKVKRIGKIVGIYDNHVSVVLFNAKFDLISELPDLENIILGKELYRESFRFSEILEIKER